MVVRERQYVLAAAAWYVGPNGEPSGMSAGGWAVTPASQYGQVARNRLIRLVIGLIGRRSKWSQASRVPGLPLRATRRIRDAPPSL
jgi:hypothetical protein